MKWYLKKSDGAVFGPVDDDEIMQWAREGRIVPGDRLSPDQKEWVDPCTLDTLELDWFIPLDDGTPFGPLHALALGDYLDDSSLGLDDTVAHRVTRETRRVCEVFIPALRRYNASLRDTLIEEVEHASERESQQADAGDHRAHERLRTELKQARQTIDEHEKELARLKQALEDERTAAAGREADLHRRMKELQDSELNLLKTLEDSRGKTVQAERRHGGGGASSDYGALAQSYDDLTKNYDLLMEQFTAKSSDLSAAYVTIDKLKKEIDERVKRLDETMRQEREEADKARQRLSKVEESHLEVVRSYRELNDRYIRLRQKAEATGTAPAPETDGKAKVRLV